MSVFGTQTFTVNEGTSTAGYKTFWMQKCITLPKILGISYQEVEQQLRDLDSGGVL